MNQFEEEINKGRKLAIRRRVVISIVGLAIALVLSFFIFISRGIDIKISPKEAIEDSQIQIVNGFGLVFGNKIYSLSSNITIVIQSDGYRVYKQDFNLNYISETIEVLLEELPGSLSIEIFPKHEKHTILFDNKKLKNEDQIIVSDLIGNYKISITNPFFVPYNSEIKIKAGEKKKLIVELKKSNTLLNIKTSPNNAQIYIDNILNGVTPLKTELESGQYEIRFEKEGYQSLKSTLEVLSNNLNLDLDYNLKLIPGKLAIISEPNNSDIFIDNVFVGKGSAQKTLNQGNYNINIIKDGYYSVNETIFVPTNQEIEKKYELKEMLGNVYFESQPTAEIFIDGISYGYTPKRIKLRSIKKKVVFKETGYRSFLSSIKSDPEIEKRVNAILLTETEARLKEAKKIIQTSSGGKLKLFIPRKLRLGASRSDPGQRANEVIRDVLLTRPFYIGINVVKNSDYNAFNKNVKKDNHPVTSISWVEAINYCNWLSRKENLNQVYLFKNGKYIGINEKANGYRLPTESEWAWVARYANQNPNKINRFAWGNGSKIKKGYGNLAGEEVRNLNIDYIRNYKDSFTKLSPVGSFKPSSSGLYDITGNVHEWVHDYYELLSFDVSKNLEEKDRTGPSFGSGHVIRGSSWKSSSLTELRLTYRDNSNTGLDDLGFRLARWIGE